MAEATILHSFPVKSLFSSLLYLGHYRLCQNPLVGPNGTTSHEGTVGGVKQFPLAAQRDKCKCFDQVH